MLFKLKNKMVAKQMINLLSLFGILLWFFAINSEAAEKKLHYHGFVAQGLIDVNGSDFVNSKGDASTELTELGLNGSFQLSSDLRLAGQIVYLNGGNRFAEGLRVDYALLDWSLYKGANWQANLFLGRFKNNHWLHSSSRDIPFARPSIILPQSIYFDGFRDIAVGADGIAFKIRRSDDDYGNFDFNFSYGTSPISDKQSDIILSTDAKGTFKQDSDVQFSLYWQPIFSSWRFGASYLDSVFKYQENKASDRFFDGDITFRFYTMNALYEGERWEFSGEIFQELFSTEGFYQPELISKPIGQGMYLQTRYKVNKELTLLARYENFYNDKNDKDGKKLEQNTNGATPAYFGYQKDTTIGLSYDFSSNIRLRFEYHWFQGTGRLTPVVLPDPEVNDSKNWQLWAMQLMYWF